MDQKQVAYIAGYLDAKGTFSIRKPQHTLLLSPSISITEGNKGMIEHLQGLLGGTIVPSKPKPRKKPIYQIWWGGRKAIAIACLLKPHLILKREQAEILSTFKLGNGTEEGMRQKVKQYIHIATLNKQKEIKHLRKVKRHGETFIELDGVLFQL